MKNEGFDAFISYKRINLHTAEMIRMKLEAKNISCFMDKSILHVGEEWENNLIKNIKKSPNFICILTEEALESILHNKKSGKEDIFLKEIRTALNCTKPRKQILSLLCNGYNFPNQNTFEPDFPDEIKDLSKLHAISLLDEDIDGSVDRLIADMKRLVKKPTYRTGTVDFIDDILSSDFKPSDAGFIFHAGADWFRETHKRDQLDRLIEKGIRLKILINTENAAMTLAKHMENPKILYDSFKESIGEWAKLQKENPEYIEVRISDIPLMRRIYFFTDQKQSGIMRVSQYTYQEFDIEKNPVHIITTRNQKQAFEIYQKEFLYLWNNANNPLLA